MQFANHLKNGVTGAVVEVARGLIGQKQFGLANQSPGYSDPLLFTPGDFTHLVVKPMTQTHTVQNLTRFDFCAIAVVTPYELRHHRILKSGKFRQKMMKLKDKTDMTVPELSQLYSLPLEDILIVKQHLTSRRPVQASEKVKQSAFSSTRRTNYRDQAATLDLEVQVFENDYLRCGAFVNLRETSRLDHSYRSASTGWSFEAAAEG